MIDKVWGNRDPFDHDEEEEFEVYCDGCDLVRDSIVTYHGFAEVCSIIRAEGWSITKQDGEWYHYCPNCAGHERNVSAVEDFL